MGRSKYVEYSCGSRSFSDMEIEPEDFALWTCATGLDYATNRKSSEASKDRDDFISEFPEYKDASYSMLNCLSSDERNEVLEWFYSSWYVTEHEYDDGYLDEGEAFNIALFIEEYIEKKYSA